MYAAGPGRRSKIVAESLDVGGERPPHELARLVGVILLVGARAGNVQARQRDGDADAPADLGEVGFDVFEASHEVHELAARRIADEVALKHRLMLTTPADVGLEAFIPSPHCLDEVMLGVGRVLEHEGVERHLPVPWVAHDGEGEKLPKDFEAEVVGDLRRPGVGCDRLRVEPGGDAELLQLSNGEPLPLRQHIRFESRGDAGPGVFVNVDKDEAMFAGNQHKSPSVLRRGRLANENRGGEASRARADFAGGFAGGAFQPVREMRGRREAEVVGDFFRGRRRVGQRGDGGFEAAFLQIGARGEAELLHKEAVEVAGAQRHGGGEFFFAKRRAPVVAVELAQRGEHARVESAHARRDHAGGEQRFEVGPRPFGEEALHLEKAGELDGLGGESGADPREAAADEPQERARGLAELRMAVGGHDQNLVHERIARGPFEAEVDREDTRVGGEILVHRMRSAENPLAGAGGPRLRAAFHDDRAGLHPPSGELVALGEQPAVGRVHFALVAPEEARVEVRPILEGEGGGHGGGRRHGVEVCRLN